MIAIRLFFFFFDLSVIIFFIVLQRNCKLKQILVKIIILLVAIELKIAHTYECTYNKMWQLSLTV